MPNFGRMLRILAGATFFLGACQPKVEPPADLARSTAETKLPSPEALAQCEALAKELEQLVRKRDAVAIDRLLSIDDIARRSISDIVLSPEHTKSVLQRIRSGPDLICSTFTNEILTETAKGRKYKYLGNRTVDGRIRLMFRLADRDNGVRYHEVILTQAPDGKLSVEDIYLFLEGDMISRHYRLLLLSSAVDFDKNVLTQIVGTDRNYVHYDSKITSISFLIRLGQKDRAIAEYKALPSDMRYLKSTVLTYLRAAEGNSAEQAAALELFRHLFPKDPAIDLHAIDYYFDQNDFANVICCIENVSKNVHDDPYLSVIQAIAFTGWKRFDQAKLASERAIAREPTLPDAYWSRITVAVREGDHVDTLKWLKKLVEMTSESVTLDIDDDFKVFAKSPQYRDWLEWMRQRKD